VAVQKKRDRLALGLLERALEQMVKVVEVIIEGFDVPALALRFAMPPEVDGLHLEAALGQRRSDDFAVAPTILTNPVDDCHDGTRWPFGGPLAMNQAGAFGAQAPANPRLIDQTHQASAPEQAKKGSLIPVV
jgi:hypothetical protein